MSRSSAPVLALAGSLAFTLLVAAPGAHADHHPPPASVALVGSLQDELGCPREWAPECDRTELTLVDGLWRGTFDVPAGDHQWKVALNDTWDESYGAGPDNMPLPLEQETRALVASLGLEDFVHLPGRCEIRDWLSRATIFAHTSRWEGFGLVLLEAMLASLPVVATRVSAVPEVVADGKTGLLFQPGDTAGIGAALAGLLVDPGRSRALGSAGLQRARTHFSVARMAEETIAVYEQAVA